MEAVRYVLDIPFGEKTTDPEYKEELVAHTFKSGGKATITAVDKQGKEYKITRILNEHPEVFINNKLKPGISIRDTIIHEPVYFGQKDLSSSGEGFETDLVEKLVGQKLYDIRNRIDAQKQAVISQCDKFLNLSNIKNKMTEHQQKLQDAEHRLRIFKDHGIEEKLQQQTNFNTDDRKIEKIISDIREYENSLTDVVNQYEDILEDHRLYKSKQNVHFFEEFFKLFNKGLQSSGTIKNEIENIRTTLKDLETKESEFKELKKAQTDKFADIRRKLEADLKGQGKQLNLEEFPELQKKIDSSKQILSSLDKENKKSATIKDTLSTELSKLNRLWNDEYKIIQKELDKVNKNNESLQIEPEYKGNKTAFIDFFKDTFKGSRIRTARFENLVNKYTDFVSIFNDFENAEKVLPNSQGIFKQYFDENLKELLTWQRPNKFTIKYHGKDLRYHSLGQRASALILFILSQKENDLIIIDQPEDDLDNQTIYEDVIKLIRELKSQTQFIFATHNANFPVLGDSEQIHSCRYGDEKLSLKSGSIDFPLIQQEIVDIMEGGEDAFNKRKEIYGIWKPQRF